MNNDTSRLNDTALDQVAGGFSFASFFSSFSPLPHAPTSKSLASNVTNYVVSHNPILSAAKALKFW